MFEQLTSVRVDRLTTRSIREWHDGIDTVYSANKVLAVLKSALPLHAEDTGTRSIAMPTNLQKRLERPTRTHLSIDQVQAVIPSGSIRVAFPFLGATRISEQLGLCWDCEPDRQRGQRRCRIRRGNFSIAAERLRWFETDRSRSTLMIGLCPSVAQKVAVGAAPRSERPRARANPPQSHETAPISSKGSP